MDRSDFFQRKDPKGRAPLGHAWPNVSNGANVQRDPLSGRVVVTPRVAQFLTATYANGGKDVPEPPLQTEEQLEAMQRAIARKPPPPRKDKPSRARPRNRLDQGDCDPEGPDPDARVPLCDITELQNLLLTLRNGGPPQPDNDTHMVRTREFRVRMPSEEITADKLMVYLEALRECGLKTEACRRARLGSRALRAFGAKEPQFRDLEEDALEHFRDKLEGEAHRRAVVGWKEPVFGGQFKDRVVGHVTKYDSRLLELLLKRHRPEYRDKYEGELKVSGGVLLVPAPSQSTDDWAKEFGEGGSRVNQKALPMVDSQAREVRGHEPGSEATGA